MNFEIAGEDMSLQGAHRMSDVADDVVRPVRRLSEPALVRDGHQAIARLPRRSAPGADHGPDVPICAVAVKAPVPVLSRRSVFGGMRVIAEYASLAARLALRSSAPICVRFSIPNTDLGVGMPPRDLLQDAVPASAGRQSRWSR